MPVSSSVRAAHTTARKNGSTIEDRPGSKRFIPYPFNRGQSNSIRGKRGNAVPTLIAEPKRIAAAGNMPKLIDEYIGRVNSQHEQISIAHMRSPSGWVEPGQAPDFDEFTIVLKGTLSVKHRGGTLDVQAGQAVVAKSGEWVQYSTPGPEGAEYIAVCLPAFSPETVHRDVDAKR